ncbi:hypothetical protein [Phenylobacterium sp.]|uniref:glycoside hydrolase family 19 protein n=1 Tax=Phenylobacterium sp. TaxID=1871053 RepID=UPI0027328B72|nr:hypothetical protein [Phenylobacterium sp.]MDP3853138.1 hypothetical protein [Phenylobacterium sp.]
MVATLISAAQLRLFAPRCDYLVMAPAIDAACVEFAITTPPRICHFLGQLHHESAGLTRLEENLNYSAERLMEVWPTRFPTLESATPFARNPRALANKVYGGRLGNNKVDDGWKHRGSGLIMNTGKANHQRVGDQIGVDLVAAPELLRQPKIAARAAGAYWADRGLNALADSEDLAGITRRVQGGSLGLAERGRAVRRANAIWRPNYRP